MKTILILLSVAFLATGCAAPAKIKFATLKNMRVDCANKEAEQEFLLSQLPTARDRTSVAYDFTMDQETRNAIMDRSYESTVRNLLWRLEAQCPNSTQYDNKCTAERGRRVHGRPDLNNDDGCVHYLR